MCNVPFYNITTALLQISHMKPRILGPVDGSNRKKILKAHKDESYENETTAYISYLHLRNGHIDTPVTFSQECLCAHNYKRRLHNVPKLRWSDKLSKEAQNRADTLASMGVFSDSGKRNKDENIYVDSIVDLSTSCRRAVESWYAESKKYNYTQNKVSNDTGAKFNYLLINNICPKTGVTIKEHEIPY